MGRTGLTSSEVERLIRYRKIKVRSYSLHGQQKWKLFGEEDVEYGIHYLQTLRKRDAPLPKRGPPTREVLLARLNDYTAEEGLAAFRDFAAGKNSVDIVLQYGIHACIAETMFKDYVRLKGGLYIDGDTLAEINALPLDGVEMPIKSGPEVLEGLRTVLKTHACVRCSGRLARVCSECARVPAQRSTSQPESTSAPQERKRANGANGSNA
jgi:hypothetical protein